jgi:hypothetical protein
MIVQLLLPSHTELLSELLKLSVCEIPPLLSLRAVTAGTIRRLRSATRACILLAAEPPRRVLPDPVKVPVVDCRHHVPEPPPQPDIPARSVSPGGNRRPAAAAAGKRLLHFAVRATGVQPLHGPAVGAWRETPFRLPNPQNKGTACAGCCCCCPFPSVPRATGAGRSHGTGRTRRCARTGSDSSDRYAHSDRLRDGGSSGRSVNRFSQRSVLLAGPGPADGVQPALPRKDLCGTGTPTRSRRTTALSPRRDGSQRVDSPPPSP